MQSANTLHFLKLFLPSQWKEAEPSAPQDPSFLSGHRFLLGWLQRHSSENNALGFIALSYEYFSLFYLKLLAKCVLRGHLHLLLDLGNTYIFRSVYTFRMLSTRFSLSPDAHEASWQRPILLTVCFLLF